MSATSTNPPAPVAPVAPSAPAGPLPHQIAAARRELADATDKLAVLAKHPWLVDLLNSTKP